MTEPPRFWQDSFTLPEGRAILQWPDGMSAESLAEFKEWLELELRKIERRVIRANEPY